MRRLLILAASIVILSLALPASAAAPVWVHQFGSASGDFSEDAFAFKGFAYVVGTTGGGLPGQHHVGGSDAFLAKFASNGSQVWMREFGTSADDISRGVFADKSGVYVAGGTCGHFKGQSNAGFQDAYVRKYTLDGKVMWTRQFGSSQYDFSVAVRPSSAGVYVAGRSTGSLPGQTNAGGVDSFVRSFTAAGKTSWTKEFGTTGDEFIYGEDSTGSAVFVGGDTNGTLPGQASSGGTDAFIQRVTANGHLSWGRQFGTPGSDTALGLLAKPSGLYVTGSAEGALPGQSSAGGVDAFLREYDSGGGVTFTHEFGTTGYDEGWRIAANSTGLEVAGDTDGTLPGQTNLGSSDGFVQAFTTGGTPGSTDQFGTSGFDTILGAGFAKSSLVVAGYTDGTFPVQVNAGGDDAFVARVTP